MKLCNTTNSRYLERIVHFAEIRLGGGTRNQDKQVAFERLNEELKVEKS